MKIVLFLLFFASSATIAQKVSYGIIVGGASTKSAMFDLFFKEGRSRYHLGLTSQFNGQKLIAKNNQEDNLNKVFKTGGAYFTTVDIKYSYVVKEKVSLLAEVSLGSKKNYLNYVDNEAVIKNFHSVSKTKPMAGWGLGLSVFVIPKLEIGVGYNTIRGTTFTAGIGF